MMNFNAAGIQLQVTIWRIPPLGGFNSTIIAFQIDGKSMSKISTMWLILRLASSYDVIFNALAWAQGINNWPYDGI